jgi:hypothetical protein
LNKRVKASRRKRQEQRRFEQRESSTLGYNLREAPSAGGVGWCILKQETGRPDAGQSTSSNRLSARRYRAATSQVFPSFRFTEALKLQILEFTDKAGQA